MRRLSGDDADTRGRDVTGANELRYHTVHDIDRDRESDARIRPRWRNDRSIDADHAAIGIEQGASRIAGIHGRIGLDDVRDFVTGAGRKTTLKGTDHAGGQRLIKAIRIADRIGELADL